MNNIKKIIRNLGASFEDVSTLGERIWICGRKEQEPL